jgi:Na+/proline symporter
MYVPAIVLVLAWRLLTAENDYIDFSKPETSWIPYFFAIAGLVILTSVYTTVGGIKAVIWTDVIQATLMVTSALTAVGVILYQIGSSSIIEGISVLFTKVPEITTPSGYFRLGFENVAPDSSLWTYIKIILEDPYTLFAAFFAATALNMAAFGTDQDMVQRLLTAETYKKSRRSLMNAAFMDIPIAFIFTGIGVLLIVFYDLNPALKPTKANDVFGAFILNACPFIIRGFILAGLFATSMGSLSAALNALATSFTNDWYLPYFSKTRIIF